MRLCADLQVRPRVPVQAGCDLLAGLPVHGLTDRTASGPRMDAARMLPHDRSTAAVVRSAGSEDGEGNDMALAAKTLVVALMLTASGAAKSFEFLPSPEPSMHVEGAGAVTVVFESGLGDTGKVWQSEQTASGIGPNPERAFGPCERTMS